MELRRARPDRRAEACGHERGEDGVRRRVHEALDCERREGRETPQRCAVAGPWRVEKPKPDHGADQRRQRAQRRLHGDGVPQAGARDASSETYGTGERHRTLHTKNL